MHQPENALARQIIGLAMKVHRTLGCGFVETVYRNALAIELRKAGLKFETHPTISVIYEGTEVGIFQADLIIEDKLIVELKAASALTDDHSAQLVNYLTATKIEEGLLLNFGAQSLQFRTKSRTYRPSLDAPDLHS
ncbi:MAG TPA: GxxExxY protein [Candidatus Methylacidiphilales bacterium]|jgi:GxxExxY protein|nr:GxxExxY protein [Candidatus Methylacidiphilales bacterium]